MEEEHIAGEVRLLLDLAAVTLQDCTQMIDQLQELEDYMEGEVIQEKYQILSMLYKDLTEEVLFNLSIVDTLLSTYISIREKEE